MSSRKEGGGGFSTSSETQKKKTGLKVKTAAMFHTRMREYFGDTNLSACTRFRSENSCRPTKAFSICRCISSLPENNHTNQHIQDVYMLKQLPHWWRLCVCVCVDCTFLPRSCRWPSCSVPLLCRETRPPTPPATPGGCSPPGSGLPEAGRERRD